MVITFILSLVHVMHIGSRNKDDWIAHARAERRQNGLNGPARVGPNILDFEQRNERGDAAESEQ